jgi:hypothetical protein
MRADLNEEGLIQFFYNGLKDEVKDALYDKDRPDTLDEYIAIAIRPDTLDEYIAIAIRIDDRQYARKQ